MSTLFIAFMRSCASSFLTLYAFLILAHVQVMSLFSIGDWIRFTHLSLRLLTMLTEMCESILIIAKEPCKMPFPSTSKGDLKKENFVSLHANFCKNNLRSKI